MGNDQPLTSLENTEAQRKARRGKFYAKAQRETSMERKGIYLELPLLSSYFVPWHTRKFSRFPQKDTRESISRLRTSEVYLRGLNAKARIWCPRFVPFRAYSPLRAEFIPAAN